MNEFDLRQHLKDHGDDIKDDIKEYMDKRLSASENEKNLKNMIKY
jgi:hypothetical protein